MGPLVQIAGAILVLVAYALLQAGVLTAQARSFILLNLVGAAVLAVEAYVEEQWGFLLLEAVWALIAAWSLVRLRSRERDIASPSY